MDLVEMVVEAMVTVVTLTLILVQTPMETTILIALTAKEATVLTPTLDQTQMGMAILIVLEAQTALTTMAILAIMILGMMVMVMMVVLFNHTATTEIYTRPQPDPLPY